jgi:hypothetical protein
MTPDEWFSSTTPRDLLEAVRYHASLRKLRQLTGACVRLLGPLQDNEGARSAAKLFADFLEGHTTGPDFEAAVGQDLNDLAALGVSSAAEGAQLLSSTFDCWPVNVAIGAATSILGTVPLEKRDETARAVCDLFRELLAPPFARAPLPRRVLRWGDGSLLRLAEVIDAEGRFAELPVLADALEEAGCGNAHLIEHCRGPNGHRPGCWALERD